MLDILILKKSCSGVYMQAYVYYNRYSGYSWLRRAIDFSRRQRYRVVLNVGRKIVIFGQNLTVSQYSTVTVLTLLSL